MSFAPMLEADVASWSGDTDVIIVGFGGAGACAAIAAVDSGASAMIVEAASASGGSTALSSAEIYLGGGTQIQKAVGYEDSVEAVFGYLMDSNGPQADAEKVRAYAEGGATEPELSNYQTLGLSGITTADQLTVMNSLIAMTNDASVIDTADKLQAKATVV